MKKKFTIIVIWNQRQIYSILFLVIILSGCALEMRTTGFLDRERGITSSLKGASFAVLENTLAPNPIFDKEIKRKIEKLLVKQGYRIDTPDKADYYLTFSYSIGSGLRVGTSTLPGPSQTQIISVPDGKGGYTWSSITVPGPPSVVPTITEEYTKQLTLKVIDAASLKNDKVEKVIWVGDTLNTGPSSDLRYVIDYLLVATFKCFGQDTVKQVSISLGEESDEVKDLRGVFNH